MISCNPYINFGMPALEGRRLTVFDIVTKLFYESSIAIAVDDYEISILDAREAVQYCMTRKCINDSSLIQFCDGCVLRTIQEGSEFNIDNFEEYILNNTPFTISKDFKTVFLGTVKEFEEEDIGNATWLMAAEVYKSL